MTEGKDVPMPPPAELVTSYIHEVLAPQSTRNSMKSAPQIHSLQALANHGERHELLVKITGTLRRKAGAAASVDRRDDRAANSPGRTCS